MELLLFFIHKFFVFTFILAILFVVAELSKFIISLFTNGQYTVSGKRMLWLGIAIAHIITTLFTGFII